VVWETQGGCFGADGLLSSFEFLDVLIYVFQAGEAGVTATISIGLAGTVGDGRGFQETTCNGGNHSTYKEAPGMADDGRG